MKKNYLNSIAIIDNAYSRNLFIDISELLKKNEKSNIHVYCQNKEAIKFYEKKNFINSLQIIPSSIDEKLKIENKSSLNLRTKKFESKYKKNIAWYSASNRILGRGFSPTAPHFPRFLSKKIPKDYINYYYCNLISFWEKEFEKKKISLLISPGLLEANIGKKFGIINRTFNSSRHKSLYCWLTDEFWNNFMIQKEFYKIRNNELSEISIDSMPKWNLVHLNRVKRNNKNIKNLILKLFKKILKHLYWFKIKKNKRNYLLISELAYIIRSFFHSKFITSKKLYNFKYLEKKKFIFFPLQVEPERNLQGNTPEFFNQFSAIIDLSLYLPADIYLVVKEHFPAAGVRSKVFYNQLLNDFPNIIFVNASIPGKDLIKKAEAVATINGTVGLEAAIIGKPVISFSKHNSYNFLDHVWFVNESEDISKVLQKIFNKNFNKKKSIIDGKKFTKAIEKISINIPDFSFSSTKLSEIIIKECYKKLLKTLK